MKKNKQTGASGNNSKPSGAKAPRQLVKTRIVDDVFTDEVEMLKTKFEIDFNAYVNLLWSSNPRIYDILKEAPDLESAREAMYNYLDRCERKVFDLDNEMHILEKATVRECVRTFKSVIGPINERRTETSALKNLWLLATENEEMTGKVYIGFLMEFINLFKGVAGAANIYFESEGAKKVSRIS